MSELITVPTFTFKQGELFDTDVEQPLHVDYFNGSIQIRQDGGYDQQESINISSKHIKAFFKEVLKHLPDAEHYLKTRS